MSNFSRFKPRPMSRHMCSKNDDNNGGVGNESSVNHSKDNIDKDEEAINSETNKNKTPRLKPSVSTKFIPFEDRDSQTILDYQEESLQGRDDQEEDDENFYLYRTKRKEKQFEEMSMFKRGEAGVFSVESLVAALQLESMKEIAVIRVNPESRYCEFLVITTAASQRHLDSVGEYLVKLHKMMRNDNDPFVRIVGDEKTSDWKVINMGYLVLHMMMPEVRQKYDIETLWCVGEQCDEKVQMPDYDVVVTMMDKHLKFLEELQATPSDSNSNMSVGSAKQSY